MCFGNIKEMNIFYACFRQEARQHICHVFGVAIHGAESNDDTILGTAVGKIRIERNNMLRMRAPNGSVNGANHVDGQTF